MFFQCLCLFVYGIKLFPLEDALPISERTEDVPLISQKGRRKVPLICA